jgi:hypothetical protein
MNCDCLRATIAVMRKLRSWIRKNPWSTFFFVLLVAVAVYAIWHQWGVIKLEAVRLFIAVLCTVILPHLPLARFVELVRAVTRVRKRAGRRVPGWLIGPTERIFFIVFVAINPQVALPGMLAWIGLKIAANWNRPRPPRSGPHRTGFDRLEEERDRLDVVAHALIALAGGLISMLFALAGGLIARGDLFAELTCRIVSATCWLPA